MFNYLSKKNILKKTLVFLGLFLFLVLPLLSVQAATDKGSYNFASESGLSLTGKEAGYDPGVTPGPESIIGQVIQVVLSFVGIIFLAFMIYAGITWLTAQGDDKKVSKAKDIIEESIVGIIIVIIAYAVSSYLLQYFTPVIGGSI